MSFVFLGVLLLVLVFLGWKDPSRTENRHFRLAQTMFLVAMAGNGLAQLSPSAGKIDQPKEWLTVFAVILAVRWIVLIFCVWALFRSLEEADWNFQFFGKVIRI